MKNLLFALLSICLSLTAFSQSDSEALEINYVWDAIGDKRNFRAFIVGSAITPEMVSTKEVLELMPKLPSRADLIVVGSEEMKKVVSEYTELKVFVASKFFDEANGRKGFGRFWVLLENDELRVSRLLSTRDFIDVITPRSERDKPQE